MQARCSILDRKQATHVVQETKMQQPRHVAQKHHIRHAQGEMVQYAGAQQPNPIFVSRHSMHGCRQSELTSPVQVDCDADPSPEDADTDTDEDAVVAAAVAAYVAAGVGVSVAAGVLVLAVYVL